MAKRRIIAVRVTTRSLGILPGFFAYFDSEHTTSSMWTWRATGEPPRSYLIDRLGLLGHWTWAHPQEWVKPEVAPWMSRVNSAGQIEYSQDLGKTFQQVTPYWMAQAVSVEPEPAQAQAPAPESQPEQQTASVPSNTMKATRIPVLVGSDTVSTWQAVWDPEREPPDAVTAAARLGYPVAYWVPAVGMLGQWRWPDDSVSNATAMPWQVQREPGGTALWSSDGGLTWAPALATPSQPPTPFIGVGGFVMLAIAAVALGMFAGALREPSRR